MKAALVLVTFGTLLFADGGALLLRKQAGSLLISVFGSPQPLRQGPADLSVLVQNTNDRSAIVDAEVKIHLTQVAQERVSEVLASATRGKAANKLLYAAQMNFPVTGVWKLVVEIHGKNSAEVSGTVEVLPPMSPVASYWPLFAVVPLTVILFAINQWLRKKRNLTSQRART